MEEKQINDLVSLVAECVLTNNKERGNLYLKEHFSDIPENVYSHAEHIINNLNDMYVEAMLHLAEE